MNIANLLFYFEQLFSGNVDRCIEYLFKWCSRNKHRYTLLVLKAGK